MNDFSSYNTIKILLTLIMTETSYEQNFQNFPDISDSDDQLNPEPFLSSFASIDIRSENNLKNEPEPGSKAERRKSNRQKLSENRLMVRLDP